MGWGTQSLRPLDAYHDFIERNLCLNRRGGVAPPSLDTDMAVLPDLII